MSFQELASPAPKVEFAEATPPALSEEVTVEPPEVSVSARAEPPRSSSPAVLLDKQIAPKVASQEALSLSVEALRGRGADFESEAAIVKGVVDKMFLRKIFPQVFDYRDCLTFGELRRFIFVKGNCIFVYGHMTDPYPLYAIQMETVIAMVEDPENPDPHSYTICPQTDTNKTSPQFATILLKEKKTQKQAYQITFDTSKDPSVVRRFMDVLETNSKLYGGEVIMASVQKIQDLAKQVPKRIPKD